MTLIFLCTGYFSAGRLRASDWQCDGEMRTVLIIVFEQQQNTVGGKDVWVLYDRKLEA